MRYVVLVGDMKVGRNGDILVTHALGSCLGLMIYDPIVKVGGLLHAMLPLSRINPRKAEEKPYMFVDTGVQGLFKSVYDIGGRKERLIVKAAGCGRPLSNNEMFKIGERNYIVLKKILWKNNVLLDAEDVGGTSSRTVYFHIDTGKVVINSNNEKKKL